VWLKRAYSNGYSCFAPSIRLGNYLGEHDLRLGDATNSHPCKKTIAEEGASATKSVSNFRFYRPQPLSDRHRGLLDTAAVS
jgi:hypothetical protein